MSTIIEHLPPWRRQAINALVAAIIACLVVAHAVTGAQAAAVAEFILAAGQLVWIILCAVSARTGPTPAWRTAVYALIAATFGILTAWQIITDGTASTWLPLITNVAAAGLAVLYTDPVEGVVIDATPVGAGQVQITQGGRDVAVAYAEPRSPVQVTVIPPPPHGPVPTSDPKRHAAYGDG